MKKLLGLLGAMGMIASTGATVVACGNKSSDGPGSDTEVNASNIEEKIKEYQKKLDRYNELREKNVKEKFTKEEKIEWVKLVVDIAVMDYEICQVDKSKLPHDSGFQAIETKEDVVKELKEMKDDEDFKKRFEDVWDDIIGYIEGAIAKYSK